MGYWDEHREDYQDCRFRASLEHMYTDGHKADNSDMQPILDKVDAAAVKEKRYAEMSQEAARLGKDAILVAETITMQTDVWRSHMALTTAQVDYNQLESELASAKSDMQGLQRHHDDNVEMLARKEHEHELTRTQLKTAQRSSDDARREIQDLRQTRDELRKSLEDAFNDRNAYKNNFVKVLQKCNDDLIPLEKWHDWMQQLDVSDNIPGTLHEITEEFGQITGRFAELLSDHETRHAELLDCEQDSVDLRANVDDLKKEIGSRDAKIRSLIRSSQQLQLVAYKTQGRNLSGSDHTISASDERSNERPYKLGITTSDRQLGIGRAGDHTFSIRQAIT
ncbi:hypothetical protein GRF29_8g3533151 [Pseudopithomyces chartarum]|uniref:Uncharacterized protein n=1 Tax=Pseudopithomyces chartarum TaxID=1892770 RepID=A0AAN6M8S4_9PLEO|nr:hypothetical protein GRF29_8g3533151 [Pseudopithomyces chartarum]